MASMPTPSFMFTPGMKYQVYFPKTKLDRLLITDLDKMVTEYHDKRYFRIKSKYNIENFQNLEKPKYKKMYNDYIDRDYFKPERRFCFSTDNTHKFKPTKEAQKRQKVKNQQIFHLSTFNYNCEIIF